MRRLVESSRPRLPDHDHPDFPEEAASLDVRQGSRSRAETRYGMYAPNEFRAKFGCGPHAVKAEHQHATVKKQEHPSELVVLVPGDVEAPRRYSTFCEEFHSTGKQMMRVRVREQQPLELFMSLVNGTLGKLAAVLRDARCPRMLRAPEIWANATLVESGRKDAAVRAALATAGATEGELEAAGGATSTPTPSHLLPPPPHAAGEDLDDQRLHENRIVVVLQHRRRRTGLRRPLGRLPLARRELHLQLLRGLLLPAAAG